MLQFSLEEEDLMKFADDAVSFTESLEELLTEGGKFSHLKVVILGAGKTDCGIS